MRELTLRQIAEATGGRLCGQDRVVDAVCTDTRRLTPGCVFLAIRGANFDGNAFAPQAVQAGAAAAIVEREMELGAPYVLVDNTRRAFLRLAAWYRAQFSIPVVGVTGSVGKTTTREMIAAALSKRWRVHRNEGNRNNDIGLPATILTLDDSYDAAVYEMGMSDFGEISALTRVARPEIGVISNIGISHIESLGSRENILRAKLEILDGMPADAPLVLNGDDDLLATVEYQPQIRYGFGEGCLYRAREAVPTQAGMRFAAQTPEGEVTVELPALGRHNVYNALAALAVAGQLGIPAQEAAQGLKNYQTTGFRQHLRRAGGMLFIEDCYNASPDSMRAGLATLRELAPGRKIAVLGDMFELGAWSERAHRLVGQEAARTPVDALYCLGERARGMAAAAREAGLAAVWEYDDKPALASDLLAALRPGDTVLFKASRGMKMEDVMQAVYAGLEERDAENH